jgi:simple sugar transport system permease protein
VSPGLRGIGVAAGFVALTIGLLAVLLSAGGHEPGAALAALWRGSFGSWDAVVSATLVRAVPLMLAGLAMAIAFRAGVLNIGGEGQLLAGAAAGTAVVLALPGGGIATLACGLLTGALGGTVWAAIPAALRHRFGVLEVISTLMLNAVALQIVAWLVRGPLQEPSHIYPQTATIAPDARLPILIPGSRLHAGIVIALVAVAATWWLLSRTAGGFRVRAAGENAAAAAVSGRINVARVTTRAFLVSGAIAGLAGVVEVQGVTLALYETLSPGYGYTAIAVALLARLDPRAIVPSALLFAALEAGATAMQRDAGVPSVLVKVVEASLILAVLGAGAWRRRQRSAPASASASASA